jgi:hypothetical protein
MTSDENSEVFEFENADDTVSISECQAILKWAMALGLLKNGAYVVDLPACFAHKTDQGNVDVLNTAEGRYFVLLKKHVGWKSNFEGVLCCSEPLRPEEIVNDPHGRSYVAISGWQPFEELYIRQNCDNRWLKVYFDLN